MTELAAAIDADDEMLTVDDLPPSPFVSAGSELIEIRSRFPGGIYQPTQEAIAPRMRVRRGAAGTTAASHSSGATLTPVYAAGSGGGGGVTVDNQDDPPAEVSTLIVPGATISGDEADLSAAGVQRLLGPFHIVHDAVGLDDNGIVLTLLDAGMWLLDVLVIPTETFDGAPNGAFSVGLGTLSGEAVDDWQTGLYMDQSMGIQFALTAQTLAAGAIVRSRPDRSLVAFQPIVLTTSGCLMCAYYPDGASTTGEADIYALIAEPAA